MPQDVQIPPTLAQQERNLKIQVMASVAPVVTKYFLDACAYNIANEIEAKRIAEVINKIGEHIKLP